MLAKLHELQQALSLHPLPSLLLLLLLLLMLHETRHLLSAHLLGGHLLRSHLLWMGLGMLLRRLLLALLLGWVIRLRRCRRRRL